MITREKYLEMREKSMQMLRDAGIAITDREYEEMEVAEVGLGIPDTIGLQIVVYENNPRYCAKELIMLPRQTCAEHRHPPVSESNPGKQETFRCRKGEVYLYIPGAKTENPKAILKERKEYFTVWNEIILRPGEQYTLAPDTLHWFQSGDEGAIVSEFSSTSMDETDVFTDPEIQRAAEIED